MECKLVLKKLKAFHDGELSSHEQAFVQEHLRGCKRCQAEFTALTRLWDVLGLYPEAEVPQGFSRRVVAHLEAYEKRQKTAGLRHFVQWWPEQSLRWATVGILFFGGLLIGGSVFELWSKRMDQQLAAYYARLEDPYEFESAYRYVEQSLIEGYWKVLSPAENGDT